MPGIQLPAVHGRNSHATRLCQKHSCAASGLAASSSAQATSSNGTAPPTAYRLAMALLTAAHIIGSSIVMTLKGGPTLFGLPVFGFPGFCGAVPDALWLGRAVWRSSRQDRDI